MKTRWALLSAAIFFGFLSNQMIAAEGVLGQGNISCASWIKSRGDGNHVVAARTAWVLGFVTAFNQYRSRPEGDVAGGKNTEVLMVRIDDHCRLHPLDNCMTLRARSLMSSDSEPTARAATERWIFVGSVRQKLMQIRAT